MEKDLSQDQKEESTHMQPGMSDMPSKLIGTQHF
jgi:hypothetical protein